MIDGHTYRLSEEIARRAIPTWELAQIHHVAFEHQAFPRGIPSIQDIPQIMNIMQENRFDPYCREWYGLTEVEIESLIEALCAYAKMCLVKFPSRNVKLPLSTMISALSIYMKLSGYNPRFESVLELGPGSGNLAFFLKNHNSLKNYSTVEACEAYYILQSMVYSENFPYSFKEHAFPDLENARDTFTVCRELETPDYLEVEEEARINHYPWWRLGSLAKQEAAFELVTTNANLMEFTQRALADYLALIKRVIKPDGIILSQCLGGQLARKPPELINYMKSKGFAAFMISSENHQWDLEIDGEKKTKYFPLRNAVFVTEGHPQYKECLKRMHFDEPVFDTENDDLVKMFGLKPRNSRIVSSEEIVSAVKSRIAGGL